MAIERIPGSPSPEWDSLVKDLTADDLGTGYAPEHRDDFTVPTGPVQYIPGMPALPTFEDFLGGVGKVDVPTEEGPLPAWLQSRPVGITAATVLPATLVTGIANLSAAQYAGWQLITTCSLITVGSMALAVAGFMARWTTIAPTLFLGLAFASAAWLWASMGSGWSDVTAWLFFAAMSGAATMLYISRTEEARATTRLIKAKSRVEDHKARAIDAAALKSQAQAYSVLMRTQMQQAAAMAVPAGPALTGRTPEETALRTAFFKALATELAGVDIVPTLTGWKATIALDGIGRSQVRTGWDKVVTSLAAAGVFKLSDGRRTNEMIVRFIADDAQSGVNPMWSIDKVRSDGLISLGFDTETGEEVLVKADHRYVWAGASGSGKSWSLRPLMAAALLNGWLVYLDPKGDETFGAWGHVARCAVEPEDLIRTVRELHTVMLARRDEMQDRGISKWDGEQITIVTDENQDMLFHLGNKAAGGGDEVMQMYRRLSSQGRSRGMVLVTATQKPTFSSGGGLDSQMAGNVDARFCLRVASEQESRTALDAYADYEPHKIPLADSTRGQGYLAGHGPALIHTWTLKDEMVRALPRRVWNEESTFTPDERVAKFVAANPGASRSEIAAGAHVPKGSLSAILGRLQSAG